MFALGWTCATEGNAKLAHSVFTRYGKRDYCRNVVNNNVYAVGQELVLQSQRTFRYGSVRRRLAPSDYLLCKCVSLKK